LRLFGNRWLMSALPPESDQIADISICPLSANERTRFAGARCARSRWRRWSDEV